MIDENLPTSAIQIESPPELVKPIDDRVDPAFIDFFTARNKKLERQDNERLLRYQLDYQKYLQDTAIRRRMNDALKAGINPIYAMLNNVPGADAMVSAPGKAVNALPSANVFSSVTSMLSSIADLISASKKPNFRQFKFQKW